MTSDDVKPDKSDKMDDGRELSPEQAAAAAMVAEAKKRGLELTGPHGPDGHSLWRGGFGGADDRRRQAGPDAVGWGDGDGAEAGRQQVVAVLGGGEGVGGATDLLLGGGAFGGSRGRDRRAG
jgi:hypothetical protein